MKPMNLTDAMNTYTQWTNAINNTKFYGNLYTESNNTYYKQKYDEALAAEDRLSKAWAEIKRTLTEIINEAEGKARSRCLIANDIMDDLIEVETHLRISKTAMKGITVTVNHNAQTFPNAYKAKGNPESTYFSAEHTGKGWRLTRIYRDTCRATKAQITLTEAAKAAIIRNAESF